MDEKRSGDAWEPWQPVEGQRVLIRLSGECQYHRAWEKEAVTPEGKIGKVLLDTRSIQDGATGIQGHPWCVVFDEPVYAFSAWGVGAPITFRTGNFATLEMEPLHEEADRGTDC